jgi:transposase-like protein
MPEEKRTRKTYTKAEKERILREALASENYAEVARVNNVEPRTFYKWIQDAKKSGQLKKLQDSAPPSQAYASRLGATSPLPNGAVRPSDNVDDQAYVKRLEEENRRLYEMIGRQLVEQRGK